MIVRKHTFDTVHYNHYYINTDECIFVVENFVTTQWYLKKKHDVGIF